jgi:hypothetical protein
MKRATLDFVAGLMGTVAILVVVSFLPSAALAQSSRPLSPGSAVNADKSSRNEPDPMASFEEEMLAKRAIKFAEKQYQENLDKARELSELGTEISKSFKQNKRLDREDIKRLDKIEKLTKGIRNAAGGSEDETNIDKPPMALGPAIKTLAELAESLKAKVEKTPRQVVSASVIDQANVLLELIRIIRGLPN